jgi:RNA polymerase sigma factor (sigma-70 family)
MRSPSRRQSHHQRSRPRQSRGHIRGQVCPPEREIFTLRFYEATTLAGIGAELDMTRERVRQLENQVIKKIRAALSERTNS